MTTFDPGARLVFTQGRVRSPRSTALRASNPAAIITDGFEVFVHEVIAAMTTAPSERSVSGRAATAVPPPPSPSSRSSATAVPRPDRSRCSSHSVSASRNVTGTSPSATRSCGRRGPGEIRFDRREIQLERLAEDRVRATRPCGTASAPSRRPRRARPAPGCARSAAGSRACDRRSGRSRRSSRTPVTCYRSSRGRRRRGCSRPRP